MSASQAAFQTAVGENVGFGDHAGQTHRIFQGKSMECGAEADTAGPLRRRREHGERISGDGELLKEVVVDGRVHIEAALVGVLDLMHDFPDHFVVRLAWRSLNFAIDAESHVVFLLLTADRLGLSRSLRLCGEAFDRPTFLPLIKQRLVPIPSGREVRVLPSFRNISRRSRHSLAPS